MGFSSINSLVDTSIYDTLRREERSAFKDHEYTFGIYVNTVYIYICIYTHILVTCIDIL